MGDDAFERSLSEVTRRLANMEDRGVRVEAAVQRQLALAASNQRLIEETRTQMIQGFRAEEIVRRAVAATTPAWVARHGRRRAHPHLRSVGTAAPVTLLAAGALALALFGGGVPKAAQLPAAAAEAAAAVRHPRCRDHDRDDRVLLAVVAAHRDRRCHHDRDR